MENINEKRKYIVKIGSETKIDSSTYKKIISAVRSADPEGNCLVKALGCKQTIFDTAKWSNDLIVQVYNIISTEEK